MSAALRGAGLTLGQELRVVWQRLTLDMRLAVVVTLVGLALATGVRIYRGRQARLHDRQHLQCRGCGHDLTGTTLTQGLGTCPECVAPFAKII